MDVEYRVELDVYNGPLDLLLYLIRRDELDIYDIPITRILDTYMEYMEMLRNMERDEGLDINVAGEFLVMAATLMEIKSAMLLPKQAPAAGEGTSAAQELADPRQELVRQLLEYKKLKDSANLLQQRQQTQEQRFARSPAPLAGQADEPPPLDLEEVQIWDLLAAFGRLMREVTVRTPREHEVIYDDTPIDLHAADIMDRLGREGRLTLRALILGRRSRSEMIGIFLALLELIRQKKIDVTQSADLGEMDIEPASPVHLESSDPAPAPAAPLPENLA
jgi:segregation and condensation protein A